MYKVKWHLKHNGTNYGPGDEFKDKPTKKLLEIGVIEEVSNEKQDVSNEKQDVSSEKQDVSSETEKVETEKEKPKAKPKAKK